MKKTLALMVLLFSLPSFASEVAACKVSARTKQGADVLLDVNLKDLTISDSPLINGPIISSCPGVIAFSPSDSLTLAYSVVRAEKQGKQTVCYYQSVVHDGNSSSLFCLAK